MGASQIYSDLGSIKPFISGNFGTADALDEFTNGFVGVLEDLIEELSDSATTEMRYDAIMDAEWMEYAPFLKVGVEDGQIQYGTVAVAPDITELEYGTPESAPNPLIRSFAAKNKSQFNQDLKERMAEELNFG